MADVGLAARAYWHVVSNSLQRAGAEVCGQDVIDAYSAGVQAAEDASVSRRLLKVEERIAKLEARLVNK